MNHNVNPVQTRAAKKAQTRAMLELRKLVKPVVQQEKRIVKSINAARLTRAEKIRAATPEIETLDLIVEKNQALRAIDAAVDRELIELRRRLVLAEKLVATRTRERDAANQAHKTRVRVSNEQLAAKDKKIDDLRKDKTMLLNKITQLETDLARKNHKKLVNTPTPTPGTNGTEPQSN